MNNKNVNTLHGTTSVRDLEGWSLAPEGAAVHSAERVAVIADVHLGYEWARGAGGDSIPAHSLAETLSRLTTLLDRVSIDRLVVAGDLVESPAPCARTAGDVRTLIDWLADRGVSLVWLMGDHDPRRASSLPLSCEVAGWTISHGNRPISGRRLIFGPIIPCFAPGD
jgi:metallophosphoesterase superfamily enzyme